MKTKAYKQNMLAWLLMGSLYAYLIVQALFVLNFYQNRDYYITEVCIEKENPNNCCKASCVLEKKLTLPENSDAESPQWLIWLPEFLTEKNRFTSPITSRNVKFSYWIDSKPIAPIILPLERPPAARYIYFI